ncbi:MAG: (2Fe-2S)-binding protein [Gammaproteobacteria bacterium]|jgi:aerobic-type carbon monoxide dehydrogenase small subunit (CoxS/CutS family)
MAETFEIVVNETVHSVEVEPDTPLLYVLMNELRLKGPRFGCGLAQCGSCSVLLEGREVRACVTPVSAVGARAVTTLEGLAGLYARQQDLDDVPALHPIQQAMIDEQAIQCGYCFSGMMVKASELLADNAQPTEAEIRAAMNGHLCRCGMYPRILKAVQAAAAKIAGEVA